MSKKEKNKQPVNTKNKIDQKQPNVVKKEILFEDYFSGKKGLYACLFLLICISVIVFKDYIFFHNVYLFKDIGSDSVNASYPLFVDIADYIRNEGFPKWSFNNGMGQNIFSFVLRDPSDIIVYMLGKDHLAYGIIYKELLKIILSGVIFYLYLRKISLTQYVSIIGGMLYSFSGFMILGSSGWYVFTMEALTLALLLLSFEKLYKDNSWYLFPISIALIGISMPFNLYLYGTFLLVYIIFRYISEKGWEIKGIFQLSLKLALLAVLGLGISSMFLFSNIIQLIESPRVSGDASYFNTLSNFPMLGFADAINYITSAMRLFSNDMMGTGINFKGWGNYLEAPLFYCGLLTLLLVPQVFGFLNKKQKIIYLSFIGLWLLPVLFPFFRYTFWLYTGDYYRGFSLCVSTAFVFLGLNALNYIDKLKKINWITLGITLIVLLIILFYPYFTQQGNPINKSLRSSARAFLIVYAILLYLYNFKKIKLLIQITLLLTLFIELTYFSSITVNKRSVISSKELDQKIGYNDYTNDAVAYLNSKDKTFFRIDKNYSSGPAIHSSLNDPQIQNYKSTPSYYSFNQLYYIKFLQGIGIINGSDETQTRWASGLVNRPLLGSLCSVKYLLSKQPNNVQLAGGFDSITKFGDVKLFRNKNYLPLGFTYDKYITTSDFHKISNLQKDISLFKVFVIDEKEKDKYNGFKPFDLKDTTANYTWEAYGKDVAGLREDTLSISEYNHNKITGKINVDKSKLLFFSIPYDKGWTATVDGKKVKPELVDFGLMGLLLDKGEHVISMDYEPPMLFNGMVISLISLLVYAFFIWKNYRDRKRSVSAIE